MEGTQDRARSLTASLTFLHIAVVFRSLDSERGDDPAIRQPVRRDEVCQCLLHAATIDASMLEFGIEAELKH
jgi:hypothetical protein